MPGPTNPAFLAGQDPKCGCRTRTYFSTSLRRSIAQSISSGVMTSGGDRRMVDPWVSLARTPAVRSRSQTTRPVSPPGQVYPYPQSAAPDRFQPAPDQCLEPSPEAPAEIKGALLILTGGEQPDHAAADRACERVSAEGGAMLTGSQYAEYLAT